MVTKTAYLVDNQTGSSLVDLVQVKGLWLATVYKHKVKC